MDENSLYDNSVEAQLHHRRRYSKTAIRYFTRKAATGPAIANRPLDLAMRFQELDAMSGSMVKAPEGIITTVAALEADVQ